MKRAVCSSPTLELERTAFFILHLQPLPGAGLESLSLWQAGQRLFPEI